MQRIVQSWFLNNTTPDAAPLLPKRNQGCSTEFSTDSSGQQECSHGLSGHICTASTVIRICLCSSRKGQKRLHPDESYRLYTTTFRGLTNWPEGFYEFLRAYRMQQQSGKLLNGGQKPILKDLYTQWLQDYWQQPAFEFVHKAFEHYFVATYSLSSAVARTNLCQENTGMMEQLGQDPPGNTMGAKVQRWIEAMDAGLNLVRGTKRSVMWRLKSARRAGSRP